MTRWNPMAELRSMRNLWDADTWPFGNDGQMDLDVYDKDGMLCVEADLPGFTRDEVKVTIEEGMLTIRAEHKEEREVKEQAYYLKECKSGMMMRAVRLPSDVDTDKIDATQKDGHLTVTMPRIQGRTPRMVTVHEA
ncbi:Hsp20/alpha crystallin family protein [Myxococcota bacterium]|nr:Hsp20/alpha crystallin family protein [Myxococcota bacterium]